MDNDPVLKAEMYAIVWIFVGADEEVIFSFLFPPYHAFTVFLFLFYQEPIDGRCVFSKDYGLLSLNPYAGPRLPCRTDVL